MSDKNPNVTEQALAHYTTHLELKAQEAKRAFDEITAGHEAAQATIIQAKAEVENLQGLQQELTNKAAIVSAKEQEVNAKAEQTETRAAGLAEKEAELATREQQVTQREDALKAQPPVQESTDMQALRDYAEELKKREGALEAKKQLLLQKEQELMKAEGK